PGGCLVWHDFGSPVAWVEVRQALEDIDFAEPVYHVAGTQVAFLHRQPRARPPTTRGATLNGQVARAPATGTPAATPGAPPTKAAGPRTQRQPLAVVWEGSQDEVQSLALVNRQLCSRLIERGHEVSLWPHHFPPEAGVPSLPTPPALAARFRAPLRRPC